jgi:hypothetical protein
MAGRLVEVGFFEERGTKQAPRFWIPFLYRPALDLIDSVLTRRDGLGFASKVIPRDLEHIENLGTYSFMEVKDAEQNVCGLDLLTGSTGCTGPYLQSPLRPWRERNGSGRSVPSLAHDLSDLVKDRISGRASSAEKGTDDAVRAQSEKHVLYTEVAVKKASRFLLCRDDHLPGFLCEPLERPAAPGFELTA